MLPRKENIGLTLFDFDFMPQSIYYYFEHHNYFPSPPQ